MTDRPNRDPSERGDRESTERKGRGSSERGDRTWSEESASQPNVTDVPAVDRRESAEDRGVQGEPDDENAALRREIRELRIELERSEQRVQSIIDHYERLLAERDRRLQRTDASEDADSASGPSTLSWWRTD